MKELRRSTHKMLTTKDRWSELVTYVTDVVQPEETNRWKNINTHTDTTSKETCKKYTGQCLRVLFFPFHVFFIVMCMGHRLFSITYFLFIFLYVGTGLVWFGGWDWLLVLEKKQLSYIILCLYLVWT